jgi:S1-C subfamily serine protease
MKYVSAFLFVGFVANTAAFVFSSKNRHRQTLYAAHTEQPLTAFPDAELTSMVLLPHRPLGCTVEESLAGDEHVFVQKVFPNSLAEQAGLRVGDVIVGVSDLFGTVVDVTGAGIERV